MSPVFVYFYIQWFEFSGLVYITDFISKIRQNEKSAFSIFKMVQTEIKRGLDTSGV